MREILNWLNENKEWVFSGIGITVLISLGNVIFRKKDDVNNTSNTNSNNSTSIEANSNLFMGDNNTSTVYNYYMNNESESDVKEGKSDFSKRFFRLKELLNHSNGKRGYEYTDEYISALLGLSNVMELQRYLNSCETPNDEFKEKFVTVFGVNRDWMVYGQGDKPFKSNAQYFGNNPIEITKDGFLRPDDKVILVIGYDEDQKTKVLFIIKHDNECFEVVPKLFDFDSNVGATGTRYLVNLYDVIQELDKKNYLVNEVYEADVEQTKALYEGKIAPKEVLKYSVFKDFLGLFSDISKTGIERNRSFLDESIISVQEIISKEKGLWFESSKEKVCTTENFSTRFGYAFPGIRETQVIDNPEECVKLLKVLLRAPIESNAIWMFRGTSSDAIDSCQIIGEDKILINKSDEFKVKKIYACYSHSYFKKFVYVETEPDKQSGADNITQDEIDYSVSRHGYCHEEFALFNGNPIKRTEYEDGAAIIDGELVRLNGEAELRVRYLSPYNFIICAHFNPINENQYDYEMENFLNDVLSGRKTVNDICNFVERLPKHMKNHC